MAAQPSRKPESPPPEWARPTHFVVATTCGHASKHDRLTHDRRKVSCRECLRLLEQALRQGAAKP